MPAGKSCVLSGGAELVQYGKGTQDRKAHGVGAGARLEMLDPRELLTLDTPYTPQLTL